MVLAELSCLRMDFEVIQLAGPIVRDDVRLGSRTSRLK